MPNTIKTLTPAGGRSAFDIVQGVEQQFNVVVAPIGSDLKNSIFRVVHMGNKDRSYTEVLLNALYKCYEKQ
ncbi:hypothetical protein AU255_03955 [Methyloprofundus sedimenti]|uniref:Uncharacterized protein n=1 Tax=Methyloprofundus sedimenti TaxID=1420851 RepID=A0A1V8M680_9GAMM|nr:hypothetical protein [Methyloprofundus sedimenti]OQK17061.1 hypothetical protein AU255_03955 [Methyloprofundus sedimenti]